MRKVVSWNCQVAREERQVVMGLRNLIQDHQPHVICLQEAMTYTGVIRREFGNWRLLAKQGWVESDNCPIMVHEDYSVARWGTVRNTTDWIGPKHGIKHPGRTWTWCLVADTGVMSLHRVTDGDDRNRKAYWEEADSLTIWLKEMQQDRHASLAIGDTNTGRTADHPGSMRRIASRANARIYADSPAGIDYGIGKGWRSGKVNLGKHYGSDHPCAVFWGIQRP